jgi:hypothetical protein
LDDSPKNKTGLCRFPRKRLELLNFLMRGVLAARPAKLFRLHALGVFLFVFCRCVVAIFAIATLQRNDFPHESVPFSQNFFETVKTIQ